MAYTYSEIKHAFPGVAVLPYHYHLLPEPEMLMPGLRLQEDLSFGDSWIYRIWHTQKMHVPI
jgi:hypothetical protein